MAKDKVPAAAEGSNPFPFNSPFLDVMSRLGFNLEHASELESFWWFMAPREISPDDVAGAIMAYLPVETEKEAALRRMGIMEAYTGSAIQMPTVKAKARAGRSARRPVVM